MSTGQTLLTIGALVIFGYLALNANRINLNTVRNSIEQQRTIDAINYGQSLVDRINATNYNDLETVFGDIDDINDPASRMPFITQIGDTLYATFQIQDVNNILLSTDGKVIEIDIYRYENDQFNTGASYKVSIPEPD